jgi:hypothetical protein
MSSKRGTVGSCVTVSHAGSVQKTSRDLFIPAYIIEPPDLALHTSLLNLLWYAVECITALPSLSGKNVRSGEHFLVCVSKLRDITRKDLSPLEDRVRRQLAQFLEEAEKAGGLIAGYLDKAKSGNVADEAVIPMSAGSEIAGLATYLQWLAVCISQELKLPLDSL